MPVRRWRGRGANRHGKTAATDRRARRRADVLRAFHRTLGLDLPGHRIEIALPTIREDLANVFNTLQNFEGGIVSAVVSPMRNDGDEPMLYLRVTGKSGRPAEKALRDAGLIVLVPEHP